ncbi:MAG: hypothetical protein ABEH77_05745 [Halobacteriaceae archaeon]
MTAWACGIRGCGQAFGELSAAIAHQVRDHERHECRVCGSVVPAGFFAIRHVLGEHTRAEYVRFYDADSDDIRRREELLDAVNERVDATALRERLEDVQSPASAD